MLAPPTIRSFQVLLHHEAVRALGEVAAELGVEIHLVGGILRDRFLGLPSRDLDAVVGGEGETIAARLAERLGARLVRLGGKDFGAYRLIARGEEAAPWVLDLWDREGTTLAADLARRDFTVDSIALAVGTDGSAAPGELVDPHGGVADLRHRVLRATTAESFRGDPLRVLRLPRLLVQLPGFTIESATLELARASAADLVEVASERVRSELGILFSHPDAARGTAIADALARTAEVGYLTRKDAGAVARLLPVERLPDDEVGRRRFLHRLAELVSTAVCYAGVLPGEGSAERAAWEASAAELARLYRREGETIVSPPRLLDGRAVAVLLDVGEGPEVGEALRALRWAQVEGRVRTRAEAEAFVKKTAGTP